MASQYDPTGTTKKDFARRILGDTDLATSLLEDEEYEAALGSYTYSVAIGVLAGQIATLYAQEPDRFKQSMGSEMEFKSRVARYEALEAKGLAGKIPEPGVADKHKRSGSGTADTSTVWTRTVP